MGEARFSLQQQATLVIKVWARFGVTRSHLVAHDLSVSVCQVRVLQCLTFGVEMGGMRAGVVDSNVVANARRSAAGSKLMADSVLHASVKGCCGIKNNNADAGLLLQFCMCSKQGMLF